MDAWCPSVTDTISLPVLLYGQATQDVAVLLLSVQPLLLQTLFYLYPLQITDLPIYAPGTSW